MERAHARPSHPKAFAWKWSVRTGLVIVAWTGGYYHAAHPVNFNEEASSIEQYLPHRRLIREASLGSAPADTMQAQEHSGQEAAEEMAGESSEPMCEERVGETLGSTNADLTVKDVAFGLAIAVVGFFLFALFLLCSVKTHDKDLRRYVWRMISSTLSVCMAVSINTALLHFFVKVSSAQQTSWILGLKHGLVYDGISKVIIHLVVSCLLFLFFHVLLTTLAWLFKENTQTMYACSTILGHCTGIAGITMFGSAQELWDRLPLTANHHYMSLFGTFLILLCEWAASHYLCRKVDAWATRFSNSSHGYHQVESEEADQLHDGGPPSAARGSDWIQEVGSQLDEAYVLIVSFLITQVIVWAATGIHPSVHLRLHFEEEPPTQAQMLRMLLPIFASMLLLMTLAIFEKRVGHYLEDFEEIQRREVQVRVENGDGQLNCWQRCLVRYCGSEFWRVENGDGQLNCWKRCLVRYCGSEFWRKRICPASVSLFSMIMSWCCLRSGQWVLRTMAGSGFYPYFRLPAMIVIINAIVLSLMSWGVVFSFHKVASMANTCRGTVTEEEMNERTKGGAKNSAIKHWDSGLRCVGDGFGLLMGMCWERAADAAVEAITDDVRLFCTHPVTFRIVAAIVSTLCIGYPWFEYIVPVASKEAYEHDADLQLELVQRKRRQTVQTEEEKKQTKEVYETVKNLFYEGLIEEPKHQQVCVVGVPVPLNREDKRFEDFWKHLTLLADELNARAPTSRLASCDDSGLASSSKSAPLGQFAPTAETTAGKLAHGATPPDSDPPSMDPPTDSLSGEHRRVRTLDPTDPRNARFPPFHR